MSKGYYNENDPRAAAWLRELIADGLIVDGDVDERSILDVEAEDLQGYSQCHFFGGIGGWSAALRLAGWPDDRPAWTGSCPCQPFSCAGKGLAERDERHLWPAFRRLIAAQRPEVVFGEQVDGLLALEWLAGVYADLEAIGYRIPKDENGYPEAYSLPACSVGAPHKRSRLFWLADSNGKRLNGEPVCLFSGRPQQESIETTGCGEPRGVADLHNERPQGRDGGSLQECSRQCAAGQSGFDCWSRSVWWPCADGKSRRVPTNEWGEVEPALFPLSHGLPGRVGLLRGAGNAIVPQVAAAFVRAFMELE